jgi:hypothetical protein
MVSVVSLTERLSMADKKGLALITPAHCGVLPDEQDRT